MHWFTESTNGKAVERNGKAQTSKVIDFAWLAETYRKAVTNALVVTLAKSLGVSFDSLRALNVGWDGEAWTFPMHDPSGKTVGIRRRLPNGKKLSVKGGHEGLFVPNNLNGESPMFVCEGPTDTAAMLTLGFQAIGRPSCSGGTAYLVAICAKRRTIIVADSDAPGLRGARLLEAKLENATVIVPPAKDMRAWLLEGAARDGVLALTAP